MLHWAKLLVAGIFFLGAVSGHPAFASEPSDAADESLSVHLQATVVNQSHGGFSARYSGQNSLADERESHYSVTSTLFLGARLWQGGELYWNPEVAFGRGLSGVLGVAGFPNGEIARVGSANPTFYTARFFVRQTFALGGESETVEPDQNQLGSRYPASRVVVTAGKLSALDIFDDNAYSHEPRSQFLNWSLMTNGAWDYPADARGYTEGVAAEYIRPGWAARLGVFAEPQEANGLPMNDNWSQAHGAALELEKGYSLAGRAGKVRLLAFSNRARMGSYRTTLDMPAYALDITRSRQYSSKNGWGVNLEQSLSDAIGGFLRAGWNDGKTESWAFTEIDRTLSFGALANGKAWRRPNDSFGAAVALNGLSRDHRDYLAAGGYGFIVGDGALNYGNESILEAFYSLGLAKGLGLSLDYQRAVHPGYNRDRGPVDIWSSRLHYEF
ncbi:MAG: carbohydrate porin [Burkholderiales bacterium]